MIQMGVAYSEKGLSAYANSKSSGQPMHSYTGSQTGLRCSQLCSLNLSCDAAHMQSILLVLEN